MALVTVGTAADDTLSGVVWPASDADVAAINALIKDDLTVGTPRAATSGIGGLINEGLNFSVGEIGAQGRDPHRRPVAERALAGEQRGGGGLPRLARPEAAQQIVHGWPIATGGIIGRGKASRQTISIDPPLLAQ